MKKIISFEKKIDFPSMIGEVTSISLEHDLKFIDSNNVEGKFIVTGTYKLTEASCIEEKFKYDLPTEILLNEKLELDTVKLTIEDFYYEIENDYTLVCHIELKIEGVEVIELTDEIEEQAPRECDSDLYNKKEELEYKEEELEYKEEEEKEGKNEEKKEINEEVTEKIKKEEKEEVIEEKETENKMIETNVSSLFSNINDSEETYSTYSVYIVREEETIQSILDKYKTSKEELDKYNELTNLKIGDKIIIPNTNE